MRSVTILFAMLAANIFAAPLNLTGTVKDENGTLENAVVMLKMNDELIAYARTLSKQDGTFALLPGKDAPGEISTLSSSSSDGNPSSSSDVISPILQSQAMQFANFDNYQVTDLRGRTHKPTNLPQGVYVVLGKLFYHKGGNLILGFQAPILNSKKPLSKITTTLGEAHLIVRKAGYLPKEVEINSFSQNVGNVVLERDPLENRIDSVMALMTTLDSKIYQMNQYLIDMTTSFGSGGNLYGSVLHGGSDYSSTVLSSMRTALNSTSYSVKIPVTYGKDMMHGAAAISGATIFPHNIGMGATRDSALVRRACEVTAKESWAGNVDLIFGPAISVPQDERWGRTYEGFGETAELAVQMGAACIRGYQGSNNNADWRVIATAKHYLGDGATDGGKDRGNSTASDEVLRALHLPGYEAAVEQGVLSVMASFNQIRGEHQHVDELRLTGWLKTELGFDGYIIADWAGISNSARPGYTDECGYGSGCQPPSAQKEDVRKAINAGLDMAMNESSFITHMRTLVNEGSVSQARVDDAVRRILRAKFRSGRMDNIQGPTGYAGVTSLIGSAVHRAIAREAVQKSLVLLKHDNNALPISKTAKIYLAGGHINSTGRQCGGWTGNGTTGWQGTTGSISGATSIQTAVTAAVTQANIVNQASQADVIIYATGEDPYAEWQGDINSLVFTDTQLASLKSQNPGKKIVTIFISGRARIVESLLSNSDAFVAAWLPGSEGAGITDVLFEGGPNFTGKLPQKWPKNTSDWFPYGYGLSY